MSLTSQTQMSKLSFQNLDTVSALKEISDEAAAVCSGGIEAVTLYDKDFRVDPTGGEALAIDNDKKRLGSFDDKTSSVIVRSGKWRLYSLPDFVSYISGVPSAATKSIVLEKGAYNAGDLIAKGLGNNSLSSIEKIG
jgi:hypothetical protein